jgi:chemotaxis protein CheZ
MTKANNDSDDLEALFDSIVSSSSEPAPAPAAKTAEAGAQGAANPEVINKIGHMTRALHDSLRELGYDKNLEKAANAIPDARDRLNYIATMTQQAAERVLNATDAAQPLVEKIEGEAKHLSENKVVRSKLDADSSSNWRRAPMHIWWKCPNRPKRPTLISQRS